MLPLLFFALPLLLLAGLVGLVWGALAQHFWPQRRWPRFVALLLALALPALVALDWPAQVHSAITLDAPQNPAAAVAAAQAVAGQFEWVVRLAVLASWALTAALLLGRGRWFWRWLAPLGPLAMAGLLWQTLPLLRGIRLSDFNPDMATSLVATAVLCLCGSVMLSAFVYLTAPRPWWLEGEDEQSAPCPADTAP